MRHCGHSVIANISLLFADVPLLDRAAQAKRYGFDGIETWWPFSTSHPAPAEINAFVKSVDDADVTLIALNLYGGDQVSGERGILSWPERQESFRSSIAVAKEVALRTECRLFNAPFGQRRDDLTEAEQYRTAVENLVSATRAMKDFGGTILLETLTTGENGNYPLITLQNAADVIERAHAAGGEENLKLLFDTYHVANNGEDPVEAIRQYGDLIAHVQVADTPGRGQPGSGSLDFPEFFSALRHSRYDGFISCEYRPEVIRKESFRWIDDDLGLGAYRQ